MNDFLTQSHWIGKFTDNELTHEEEIRLLDQASHNPLLRNELRLDRDISELVADYDRIQLSEAIRKTMKHDESKVILPIYLKIAASVMILVTLAGIAGLLIHNTNQNIRHALHTSQRFIIPRVQGFPDFLTSIRTVNTTLTPAKRREFVQNNIDNDIYTPRPEYELLVGTVTRDISVFVISPVPRVKCKSDSLILFSWRWMSCFVPVSLEITDNHGHLVLNNMQMTDESFILSTKCLARGLYYYKISAGEELVTMGSISIY